MTRSLLRHILTAIGMLLGMIGLNEYTGAIDYLSENLAQIWDSVVILTGAATTVLGFFFKRDKEDPVVNPAARKKK